MHTHTETQGEKDRRMDCGTDGQTDKQSRVRQKGTRDREKRKRNEEKKAKSN